MAKIIVDGQEIECREGIPVLQAALDAGWNVPHYCYHPALKIVASCRLCLMEQKVPHPKTGELGWMPKLVPSCQTPAKDGMEVRFASEKVQDNQKECMEYFLLNHPLDCPVCDQAGECHLQDYSYQFGSSTSRMVDQKHKNPKKDIGPKTLLYQDRCVMCTRCVRFTEEISGTHELSVINRGSSAEIDVFPGFPLDNPLQGNVVDICPVGSLLDKDFLFEKRVWELKSTDSVCAGCARGCSIRVDHADDKVYRIKPRFNPKVNSYWICDEGRYGFNFVEDQNRISRSIFRRGGSVENIAGKNIAQALRFRVGEHLGEKVDKVRRLAVMISPFASCEEAWLLSTFALEMDENAALALGPVPLEGEDQHFPAGATNGDTTFTILAEKAPNRAGVERILKASGATVVTHKELGAQMGEGNFSAAWILGGYPNAWIDDELVKGADKLDLLVVQDLFESKLSEKADVLLPACAWVERSGSFVNRDGLVQAFERAINPPEGAMREGQLFYELAGQVGLFSAERVRELMSSALPEFSDVWEPPKRPAHAH